MKTALLAAFALSVMPLVAIAQDAAPADPAPGQNVEAPAETESLKVFFPTGSSRIDGDQQSVLDQAARTFRDGDPYVMIVSGLADTVGRPDRNLALSLKRATAVAEALSARGIPIEGLQVLGRGNSELEVDTNDGVAEPANRVVEITWR